MLNIPGVTVRQIAESSKWVNPLLVVPFDNFVLCIIIILGHVMIVCIAEHNGEHVYHNQPANVYYNL